MRTLLVYYSRTGTTRKAAEKLAEKLGADLEDIKSPVNYAGAIGYLRAGRDGTQRNIVKLEPLTKNVADYDLIIIGTPIWGWNMAAPVRAFLTEQKKNLKQAAFFCTMGGSFGKTFVEMEEVSGKKPLAILALTTKEVVKGETDEKLVEFARKLG